jgi:hypothetical protein
MQNSPPLFLLVLIAAGVLGAAVLVAGHRVRPAAPSRGITLIAVLPALAMLGLFCSLAIHMHQSLGAWPTTIGTRGFPSALITHADLALQCFGILFLVSMVAWPVACALCIFIRRWRGALFHLGVYSISCSVCFAAMLLAPSPFLYWWWD